MRLNLNQSMDEKKPNLEKKWKISVKPLGSLKLRLPLQFTNVLIRKEPKIKGHLGPNPSLKDPHQKQSFAQKEKLQRNKRSPLFVVNVVNWPQILSMQNGAED